MTFATFLFLLLGKKISLKERLLLQESLNNVSLSGIVRLVKRILIFTAVIEMIGGIILSIRFSFDMPIGKAIYYGFFHSISNFNNAGFDLMGEFRSLTGYVDDPIVVLTICALNHTRWIRIYRMNELYEYLKYPSFICAFKNGFDNDLYSYSRGNILILLFEYGNRQNIRAIYPHLEKY